MAPHGTCARARRFPPSAGLQPRHRVASDEKRNTAMSDASWHMSPGLMLTRAHLDYSGDTLGWATGVLACSPRF